jgi:5-carboxymethyl-2-hydroxymuconate isomerase
MPHITLDYSANLEPHIDIPALCNVMREAAIETGAFPTSGIRVRSFRADYVSIADGSPTHGFLDCAVKMGAGRDEATRVKVAQHLFKVLEQTMQPAFKVMTLGLSLEINEITAATSLKVKNIP